MALARMVCAIAWLAFLEVLVQLPMAVACHLVALKELATQFLTDANVQEAQLALRAWNRFQVVRRIAITGDFA